MSPRLMFVASETPVAQASLARLTARYGQTALENADVVVALGGDGLMLSTLHRNTGLPVYGMNRGTIGFMIISFGLLSISMKTLPLGTAYAIWTGVGAVGTVIAGIILFGESMALFRLASVALIICGLVGLKIST